MGIHFAIFALLGLAGLSVTFVGLFNSHKSLLISVVALAVAAAAFLGAGYAWTESNSLPWTVGYGAVVLISVISAVRQFVKR